MPWRILGSCGGHVLPTSRTDTGPVDSRFSACGAAWQSRRMGRYTLNPVMPVLLRPDGTVQVGWEPRRAVLVRPPAGLTPARLAELLRTLQAGATLAELRARFAVDARELVASLVDAGVVTTSE